MPNLDAIPEISCRPLRCLIVTFRAQKGEAALLASLERAAVNLPLSFLEDENNWVSFALAQRLLDQLSVDSESPEFPRLAGLSLATTNVLGFTYSILRALATPRQAYQRLFELAPHYNRVGSWQINLLEKTRVHVEYRSRIVEPNRRFCEFRQGNLQSLPRIWGLRMARVKENSCQARGDACCSYQFEWQLPPVNWATLIGLFSGLLGGAAAHWGGLIEGPWVWTWTASAAAGAVLGALVDSRSELRARDGLLERQTEDLVGSVQSLTARFEEITVLNHTLEEKVEARTRELSEARDKLQAALGKAVALDRAKTQFFTNISHELRTPLTLILAPLETALSEWSDAPSAIRGQLEMMHRNGVRLLDNINQLLDLSRLDAGRTWLKIEEVDADAVLRGLVDASQGLARQRGVELRYEAREQLPLIPADRDKLEKIALNLIGNALKFTRRSSAQPSPWVVVRAQVEQGRFVFSVSDSGIGIAQEYLGTIFERFSQVSDGDRREYSGSGIGLALAKELAEFHMGTIHVSSLFGVGSTFTISLPLSRNAIPEDRLDRRREQKGVVVDRRVEEERIRLSRLVQDPHALDVAAKALLPEPAETPTEPELAKVMLAPRQSSIAEATPASDLERPLLLLVDDNYDMLSFLSRLLEREYRVLTAGDGEAALALARQEHPALVVSDVMMPRMDGYALLRELRADEATRHIPVVLLTAKSELAHKIQGLEEGADDYLSKPFNFLEFKTRVRGLLRNRELERMLAEKNEYLNKLNFDLVLSKKEVFLQTIEAITFALEAKDTYTHGHSYRVAVLASNLAREMRLSEAEVERVRLSALLHDVGKIGISEAVLRKPGKLTVEEYLDIQRHPEIGARILEGVGELKDVTRCVRFHHEAWDGTGYPGVLRGRAIPLESRVIAVADTYDAMTSDRAYRKNLGHERAINEIRNYAARQFDPEMVKAFLRLYEKKAPVFPAFPSAFTGS